MRYAAAVSDVVKAIARALLLLLLLAVACGGGEPDGDTTLRMEEFRFEPERLSDPGPEVEFVVHNDGAVTHDWTLLRRSIASEAELTDDLIIEQVVVPSGETAAVSLAGLDPGLYQYVCGIPGHFSLGMHGTLEVTGE